MDPALSYNTNGDFPLAWATGVCISGANGVEVNSYAPLRRSNWSQLGRCSQPDDLLWYSNPRVDSWVSYLQINCAVAIETTKLTHVSQPQCRCHEWVCKCTRTLLFVMLTVQHGSRWDLLPQSQQSHHLPPQHPARSQLALPACAQHYSHREHIYT